MRELVAVALVVSLGAACTTTTSHRVPFAGNPAEEAALVCVEQCRLRRTLDDYAACLDRCPGATRAVNDSCDGDTPGAGVCVETSELDGRSTALGVFAGTAGLLAIGAFLFIGMLLSLGGLPLLLLAGA